MFLTVIERYYLQYSQSAAKNNQNVSLVYRPYIVLHFDFKRGADKNPSVIRFGFKRYDVTTRFIIQHLSDTFLCGCYIRTRH